MEALEYPFDRPPEPGQAMRVAPGVGWLRMPLPFALDHVNLWLLEDGDALTAVDTGIGLDAVRERWQQILAAQARALRRIVVTHGHPDHLGLAQWLAATTGAAVAMTQSEFLAAHAIWHQLPGHSVEDMLALFRGHGLDEERCAALARRGSAYRKGVPALPASFERLLDGTQLAIGGRVWRVIAGYGHSPEHASLYCEELGVLISGDMLLPRISTNVSVIAAMPHSDPLAWFLDSLQRIKALPADTLVLPSHGFPFKGPRERVEQLVAHHRERCELLLAACDRHRTAGELLELLFPRALDTHQVMFAMGEAIAHLNHLACRGEMSRTGDAQGRIRFVRNT